MEERDIEFLLISLKITTQLLFFVVATLELMIGKRKIN